MFPHQDHERGGGGGGEGETERERVKKRGLRKTLGRPSPREKRKGGEDEEKRKVKE